MMVTPCFTTALSGLGELAIAALLACHVDDDAARLHRLFTISAVMSLGAGLPGISAVVMMMSTSRRLLARTFRTLRLLEALAHDFGVAAAAAEPSSS